MRKKLRLITLDQQGLLTARPFGSGSQAVVKVLEQLGYIQIDTLAVIERAHHHTLWSRVPDYQPEFIQQLITAGHIFEYWFHAASFLPMSHYRFVLPQMQAVRNGQASYSPSADAKSLAYVLDRIRLDGPLKARDFAASTNTTNTKGKWWDWKPAKRALEKLFLQGDLMISARQGMEKVYDLTERVLPAAVDTRQPSLAEFAEYLVDHALQAYGFTTLKQLTHLRPGDALRKMLLKIIQQKIEQGSLSELAVAGMPAVYINPVKLDAQIPRARASVRVLSPFDNAIIHRPRVLQLFDFDYKLECYVSKDKREFGYFCLPILFKDKLVGRVDCKAQRNSAVFHLLNLSIEDENINLDQFIPAFVNCMNRFAKFNQCQCIRLAQVKPRALSRLFKNAFALVAE